MLRRVSGIVEPRKALPRRGGLFFWLLLRKIGGVGDRAPSAPDRKRYKFLCGGRVNRDARIEVRLLCDRCVGER